MKTPLNIAVLGCGTVGGGVAQILTQQKELLSKRAGREINLKFVAELNPEAAMKRFSLDEKFFYKNGQKVTIDEILADKDIDVVVETMGGKSDFVHNTCLNVLKNGKDRKSVV